MPASKGSFSGAGALEIYFAAFIGLAGLGLFFIFSRRRGSCQDVGKSILKFIRIHNEEENKNLIEKTTDLLLEEWPNRFTNAGFEEHNFVNYESLSCSSDELPCHLLAVKSLPCQKTSEAEVVGHIVLRKGAFSKAHGKEKFAKMMKVGVPVETVRKAAQVMGVDISSLVNKFERGESFSADELSSGKTTKGDFVLASLVVAKEYRGRGIGKALCAYAAVVADQLNASRLVGSCPTDLIPFYNSIGGHKTTALDRQDIPKVKLGNEMNTVVNPELISGANEILDKTYFVD